MDSRLAQHVTAQLLALSAAGDDPITVFIHSEGGHVEAGDSIHDIVRFVKPKVRMIGTGWVASAGTHIYLAAAKKDRFCLPNTRFMIHQPLGGIGGKATDIRIEAEEILKARERLNRTIADATGQPLETRREGHRPQLLDVPRRGARVRHRREDHQERERAELNASRSAGAPRAPQLASRAPSFASCAVPVPRWMPICRAHR